MLAAQRTIQRQLVAGDPSDDDVRAYVRAVETHFGGFAREAATRLADLDKRIARISQVQFNLQAERGVALARVKKTQGVLSAIGELRAQ